MKQETIEVVGERPPAKYPSVRAVILKVRVPLPVPPPASSANAGNWKRKNSICHCQHFIDSREIWASNHSGGRDFSLHYPPSSRSEVKEWVELYLQLSIRLHGVVIN
jgi:hypothetical protein